MSVLRGSRGRGEWETMTSAPHTGITVGASLPRGGAPSTVTPLLPPAPRGDPAMDWLFTLPFLRNTSSDWSESCKEFACLNIYDLNYTFGTFQIRIIYFL